MAKKGKTARPAVPKPKSPTEARAWLRALSKQIKKHLDEHEAHETLADEQHLRWFAGAAAAYMSKKTPKGKKESLEQLLGLKAGPGRPSKPGRHFGLGYEMFLLRSTKSPTRKSKKGKSTPKSWKEVGKPYGLDGKSARKIVERELPNITEAFAKKLEALRAADFA